MDALLLLMVLIWGANYSVVKHAFAEVPPQAFNALRVFTAAALFQGAVWWARHRSRGTPGMSRVFFTPNALTPRDRWDILWVGLVGHLGYQSTFIEGLGRTSAASAALIIGATPAAVAIISAALRLERISRVHWLGVGVSLVGLYFIVANGTSAEGDSLSGDLLVVVAAICWAVYTLGSGRIMARHSPLYVTGMTMAVGGFPYALIMLPQVWAVDWRHVSLFAWAAIVLSAIFALGVSYLIWYAAVQRIGSARTSIYSNLVPVAAMGVAWVWLQQPISTGKLIGAAAVMIGVFLTRLGRGAAAVPIEE